MARRSASTGRFVKSGGHRAAVAHRVGSATLARRGWPPAPGPRHPHHHPLNSQARRGPPHRLMTGAPFDLPPLRAHQPPPGRHPRRLLRRLPRLDRRPPPRPGLLGVRVRGVLAGRADVRGRRDRWHPAGARQVGRCPPGRGPPAPPPAAPAPGRAPTTRPAGPKASPAAPCHPAGQPPAPASWHATRGAGAEHPPPRSTTCSPPPTRHASKTGTCAASAEAATKPSPSGRPHRREDTSGETPASWPPRCDSWVRPTRSGWLQPTRTPGRQRPPQRHAQAAVSRAGFARVYEHT